MDEDEVIEETPAPEPEPVVAAPEQEVHHSEVDLSHEHRLTQIEERQAQHAVDVARELSEMKSAILHAVEDAQQAHREHVEALASRVEALERREEGPIDGTVEDVEELPEAAAEIAEPEIEHAPSTPDREPRGIRARRKAKKGKH